MPQVPGQPPTHHPMQVPMGNQYRVSPDSHLTTRSLCDIYLFVSCLFGKQNFFGVSPRVSYTLRHFSGFHRWIRCLTRFSDFSPKGGIYPLLATPETFHFPFSFNTVELNWTLSHPKPSRFNTKHSAKSIPCTHSHVMWCYRTPMQCNLCHCTQTRDQCMKTSAWTFYIVHYVCL